MAGLPFPPLPSPQGLRGGAAALAMCVAIAFGLALPAETQALGVLSSFAGTGSKAGQTTEVGGIAIGPNGLVYASDIQNHRINVFSSDGRFVRAFGRGVDPAGGDVCTPATDCQKGTGSPLAGGMLLPIDVEVDTAGLVYVADAGNQRIDVFSPEGIFIRAFGKGVGPSGSSVCTAATNCMTGVGNGSAGSLPAPSGIAIDSAGMIYVSSANDRIDVFSPDGTFVRGFGRDINPSGGNTCTTATGCRRGKDPGLAGGISSPLGVAVNADGLVAVSDAGNRRIDVFSPEGAFIRAFGQSVSPSPSSPGGMCTAATECKQGTEGMSAGAFKTPAGIAIGATGNLIVSDFANHRVNELTFDGTFVRAFGEGVLDGSPSLQICTAATGCRSGTQSNNAAATPSAYATAVDCAGAIYVGVDPVGSQLHQVERFGEPGSAEPPCPPSAGPSLSSAPEEFVNPAPPRRRKAAKPTFTVELNKGSGTATLVVIVSDIGLLSVDGKGIRKVKQQVKRIGLTELLVAASGAAKRKLEQTGKAKVKMRLTFKPKEGGSTTQVKSLGLKMSPGF